ncbi:hypothetical protein V500_01100 [Pseudogymnoascus sp. VKM F-4518 (FW-2643)]|nr:hypothetical protein V500_01100 [Pseudogymnoascus sp. VKM F-4518 (FW-2643)]
MSYGWLLAALRFLGRFASSPDGHPILSVQRWYYCLRPQFRVKTGDCGIACTTETNARFQRPVSALGDGVLVQSFISAAIVAAKDSLSGQSQAQPNPDHAQKPGRRSRVAEPQARREAVAIIDTAREAVEDRGYDEVNEDLDVVEVYLAAASGDFLRLNNGGPEGKGYKNEYGDVFAALIGWGELRCGKDCDEITVPAVAMPYEFVLCEGGEDAWGEDAWGVGGGAVGGEEDLRRRGGFEAERRIWSTGDGVSAMEVEIVGVGVVLKASVHVSSIRLPWSKIAYWRQLVKLPPSGRSVEIHDRAVEKGAIVPPYPAPSPASLSAATATYIQSSSQIEKVELKNDKPFKGPISLVAKLQIGKEMLRRYLCRWNTGSLIFESYICAADHTALVSVHDLEIYSSILHSATLLRYGQQARASWSRSKVGQ